MTDKPRRRRWQFRIGTILTWMLIAALAICWWMEHQRYRRATERIEELNVRLRDQHRQLRYVLDTHFANIATTNPNPPTRDLSAAMEAYRKALAAETGEPVDGETPASEPTADQGDDATP